MNPLSSALCILGLGLLSWALVTGIALSVSYGPAVLAEVLS